MTEEELLHRLGVAPGPEHLPEIRRLLAEQGALESSAQGGGDTTVMRLVCFYLFQHRRLPDGLRVWKAKQASFDAACSIDVSFMCGAGVDVTLALLAELTTEAAGAARARIVSEVEAGQLSDAALPTIRKTHLRYYS